MILIYTLNYILIIKSYYLIFTTLAMNVFEELQLPQPYLFNTYDDDTQQKIIIYLQQLDGSEKIIYRIAHEHLESSFNIVKSVGFIKWCQKQ